MRIIREGEPPFFFHFGLKIIHLLSQGGTFRSKTGKGEIPSVPVEEQKAGETIVRNTFLARRAFLSVDMG